MVDSMVKVYKQKEDGSLLKGAQLTVASTKTKNRVDQWITGQHLIDIDNDMKKKMLKREAINQIIQINQVIDMNLKIKIIKKQVVLFTEHLRLKIKLLFLVMNIKRVEMKIMNLSMNI